MPREERPVVVSIALVTTVLPVMGVKVVFFWLSVKIIGNNKKRG